MAFTRDDLVQWLGRACNLMQEHKQQLCDLDSALGDGDLGLTMSQGFEELKNFTVSSTETDLGKLIAQAGMAMSKKVPSSMGTLVASGFMAAGKACKGKSELTDQDLAELLQGFTAGVKNRGKAEVGDRTIVDALAPASEAFCGAVAAGKTVREAAEAAYQAAQQGSESTKQMLAKFGRAVYYGDKVLGVVDQGSVVAVLLYEALAQA